MNYFWQFIIGFVFVLFSCKSDKNSEKQMVFRMNFHTPLAGLDPAFARDQNMHWLNLQIFNGLVRLDKNLIPEAAIAKSWEISDSGKKYTFTLRSDVSFQNHAIFNNQKRFVKASDFEYSFTRILNPATASPGQWIFRDVVQGVQEFQEGKSDKISGFSTINDSVFQITLTKAFPAFLSLLTMPYASVVPPEVVEYEGKNFRFKPIGTGPFQLFHWTDGQQLILHKNNDHFESSEYFIPCVEIRFITSQLSAFAELSKGDLDFISGIDAMFRAEILDKNLQIIPKYRDKLEVKSAPLLNTEYLAFRMDSTGVWQDIRIRKAMAYSIDKEALVKYLLQGLGSVADQGFSPKGIPGFSNQLNAQPFNLDSAKILLAKAGYPEGKNFPEINIAATPSYQKLMLFIQKSWLDIGIKTKLEILEGPVIREMVSKGKLACWRASWVADYPDMENYLALLYSNNFSPQGPNNTHFSNQEFDHLYRKSQTFSTDSLRWKIYNQMENIILQNIPIIPLYYDQSLRIYRKGWTSLEPNAMNLLILKGVKRL